MLLFGSAIARGFVNKATGVLFKIKVASGTVVNACVHVAFGTWVVALVALAGMSVDDDTSRGNKKKVFFFL